MSYSLCRVIIKVLVKQHCRTVLYGDASNSKTTLCRIVLLSDASNSKTTLYCWVFAQWFHLTLHQWVIIFESLGIIYFEL